MTTTPSAPAWTVFSVLEKAYTMARDNFPAFITVTLIAAVISIIVDLLGLGLLAGLVQLVVSAATTICITWGALQVLGGRKPGWEPILRQVQGPLFGRMLLLGVLQYLVIGISAILVIPPFFLLPLWAVTIPAMMVERADLGTAFQRSMDLTRDRRLRDRGLRRDSVDRRAAAAGDLLCPAARGEGGRDRPADHGGARVAHCPERATGV